MVLFVLFISTIFVFVLFNKFVFFFLANSKYNNGISNNTIVIFAINKKL